mmetsp:Transcript_62676/g.75410  ORF Transcript_62676/g.75410 Transcript_62676/m.75410 type:complete len:137 (-) Transcript_62676:110-520(-)
MITPGVHGNGEQNQHSSDASHPPSQTHQYFNPPPPVSPTLALNSCSSVYISDLQTWKPTWVPQSNLPPTRVTPFPSWRTTSAPWRRESFPQTQTRTMVATTDFQRTRDNLRSRGTTRELQQERLRTRRTYYGSRWQ